MLEIIQLNHLLTNTNNAEKSTLVQQENIPLYHELAVERMAKKTEKNLKQTKKLKKSDSLKVKGKNKGQDKKKNQGYKKEIVNRTVSSASMSEIHIIDIEI